jgi:hypothetical protein
MTNFIWLVLAIVVGVLVWHIIEDARFPGRRK